MQIDDEGPAGRGGRIPILVLAAVLAVVVGAAGLVRGLVAPSAADPAAASVPASAVEVGDIAVYGAWVREPATDQTAAAYLTITNVGDEADTLTGVTTGASKVTSLHDIGKEAAAKPSTAEEAMGAESMTMVGSVRIAPGQTVTLAPTAGHLMLEQLIGALTPGQDVNILLQFAAAGTVVVVAPVVAIGDPPRAV